MKKFYFIVTLFICTLIFAQVPQGFSYQTIAFNASGAPIANGTVALKISILENAATGTVVYSETHTKTTNAKGLVNLNIGQGTPVSGTFAGVNWGTNTKFVKVEMDPAGGTNYTNVGINQLMSVPYALVADKVNMNTNGSSLNDDIVENKDSNFAFIDYSGQKVYVFNSKLGAWTSQTYVSTSSPTVVASNGNFSFADYSGQKVHAFNSKLAAWTSQTYVSTSSPTVVASNGNFSFADYSGQKVYVFNSKLGAWTSQTYVSTSSPTVVASNGNFSFADYSGQKVYVFNSKLGAWTSQTYVSTSSPTVVVSETN